MPDELQNGGGETRMAADIGGIAPEELPETRITEGARQRARER